MPGRRKLWQNSSFFGRAGSINSLNKSKKGVNKSSNANDVLKPLTMGNPQGDMNMVPTVTINGSTDNQQYSGDVCLLTESPMRILKHAANGNLKELEKLYNDDPTKLSVRDCKGRTAFHHAAIEGQVAVMEFILEHGRDINEIDKEGNTALHLVAEAGHEKAASFLLSHNADSSMKNSRNNAPLHVACEFKQKKIVDVFCSFPGIDVNIEGDHGGTPLHYCAFVDGDECARKLIESGAKMCKPCHIGYFPLHIAAQNSSKKTFQVFMDIGKKNGYSEESINHFINQEKNSPLHTAVNSGDCRIVKFCLDIGAQIDAKSGDGSTSVHMAAAFGCLDIMKLLFDKQPDKKMKCIMDKDINGRTPLHRAALFDRGEIVEYLLQQGSNVNEMDDSGLTPWLLAASKKAWNSVTLLLKTGIDHKIHDKDNRNILHIIIINGGKPDHFNICFCSSTFSTLLNEPDNFGSTPMHYAAKAGMLGTIESMIKMGAILNAKNKDRQSPLHFAASWGRYNTCKHILDTSSGPNSINDSDGEGRTPLHEAANSGHVRVVGLFLQRGASPYKDILGNSPIHMAAANGYTQTIRLLLGIHSHLLDMPNKEGETPLHLAANGGHANVVTMLLSMGAEITQDFEEDNFLDKAIKNEHKDVCVATVSHDRWREVMNKGSKVYGCPMAGFVKLMPSVCQMVLDRCRTSSSHDKNSKKFHHIYDFSYLQASKESREKHRQEGTVYQPLCTLNLMIRYNRVECLSHPLVINYLRMKWGRIGLWFHLLNLLVYLVFLGALTTFILGYGSFKIPGHGNETIVTKPPGSALNNYTGVSNNATVEASTAGSLDLVVDKSDREDYEIDFHYDVKLSSTQKLVVVIILCFCIVNALKEIAQMYQQKLNYFLDITNLWEWILYISSALFIGPFLAGHNSSAQWQCAAIAVFLAWFNLLIFLQRFDFFGIYVVMFMEILKTLVQVLTVFSILIVAFGLTFYVLFFSVDDAVGFDNFWLSLATTTVMMTGSIEYVGNWLEPFYQKDLMFQILTFIMLIAFIMLIPILLVNLLIGLAVGDIEAIQRDARLKRIAMQVIYNTDIESKMPYKILEMLDVIEYKVYPNCSGQRISMLWNKVTKTRGAEYDEDGSDASGISTDQMFQMEHQNFIYEELNKQKLRLKHISTDLSKQHDLLKLIIQKMEIKTEADEWDDSNDNSTPITKSLGLVKDMGWSSPMLRHNLLKQSHIIAKWKTIDQS